MVHHTAKRQKVDDSTTYYNEAVLFNTDTLSKIVSYLPSVDLLNLALTSKRFGVSNNDELSVIKKSVHIIVQDIATEEQLAALPHYEGESSLADYHYLQLMREPLIFDQLVGDAEYVNEDDKTCAAVRHIRTDVGTAISNNIMRTGKHYVSIQRTGYGNVMVGVMRPGQANQEASGLPLWDRFYPNFSRRLGHEKCNNNVHCCMYNTINGLCFTSDWPNPYVYKPGIRWDGWESMTSDGEIGMLLDLDEGTLSVYINGRKLGVMKKGLAGPYCWVVVLRRGTQATIKRGTIPPD